MSVPGGLPWTDIQIPGRHPEAVCLEEAAPFSKSYKLILEVGCGFGVPPRNPCWTRSTVQMPLQRDPLQNGIRTLRKEKKNKANLQNKDRVKELLEILVKKVLHNEN